MTQQIMWNEKYSRKGYLYGKAPNAFLKYHIDRLDKACTVLFLGEGEGRNACYAASKGIHAVALDASDTGLQKARDLAAETGVKIQTVHTDLQTWKSDSAYDAVMASFLHLNEPLRTQAFHEAIKALKPSKCFYGEFFSTEQLPLKSGGPKDESLLYTLDSLRAIFTMPECEIIVLEALTGTLDEGNGHQGEAKLIRAVVQKR